MTGFSQAAEPCVTLVALNSPPFPTQQTAGCIVRPFPLDDSHLVKIETPKQQQKWPRNISRCLVRSHGGSCSTSLFGITNPVTDRPVLDREQPGGDGCPGQEDGPLG